MRNEKARRYLSTMRKKLPMPFLQKFPNADPLAIRLLERMLAFDPRDRPTAEEVIDCCTWRRRWIVTNADDYRVIHKKTMFSWLTNCNSPFLQLIIAVVTNLNFFVGYRLWQILISKVWQKWIESLQRNQLRRWSLNLREEELTRKM